MSDLPIDSMRLRPKSSQSRNYKNIQLHACLDEAKLYQDRVIHHFSQSKFENHTLQSAERVYEKEFRLNAARSASNFRRSSSALQKNSNDSKSMIRSGSKLERNPEAIFGVFEEKTMKISKIKSVFDDGTAEKHQLKRKMQELKRLLAIEKNRKAKVSLNNSKLMNDNVLSNYQISKLTEQSRRNNILISELENEVDMLSEDNSNLMLENSLKENQIKKMHQENNQLQQFINKTRRSLFDERKILEETKQAQTISYKEMTNNYMVVNQLKEEKALLLNAIEVDVANYS